MSRHLSLCSLATDAGQEAPRRCISCPISDAHPVFTLGEDGKHQCEFDNVAVEARQPLPTSYGAAAGVAVVRRGLVVRQRDDGRGVVTAMDVVGPGQAFRTSTAAPDGQLHAHAVTGYAVDRTLLCIYEKPELPETNLSGELYALLGESLDRVERFIVARARPAAVSRLAALLCVLQDSLGPRHHGGIPGSLQQQDMASLLFMRHESVCRALRSLQNKELISRDGDGIVILDRAGLELV